MDIDILKTEYTENVYMEMIVQAENYGQFVQKITDAFSGKISVVKIQQQKFGKSESQIHAYPVSYFHRLIGAFGRHRGKPLDPSMLTPV